jgi:mannonate dehydratase
MGVDVSEVIRRFGAEKKLCYVHFRNVRGAVPKFDEVFVDEGDTDMVAAMRAYHEVGFDGVLIPDHTPTLTCPGPWHAGMAFAVGYMRAIMQTLGMPHNCTDAAAISRPRCSQPTRKT